MSGDLLTLRMMVVSAQGGLRELWREGAALASVPIEFTAAEAPAASAKLKHGGFDIVVLDAALPPAEREAALKAARAAQPAPLLSVLTPPGIDDLQGVAFVFQRPANTDDVRILCERCIGMRVPKRVLVVDDSRTMRSIVRKILSASRFALEVAEAEEGLGAIQKLNDGYDLVLLDYNMPGFNGIETLSEIKRVAPRTSVVMMTANEDDAIAGRARSSGAVAFLKKPFYPADIDAVLERIYQAPGR